MHNITWGIHFAFPFLYCFILATPVRVSSSGVKLVAWGAPRPVNVAVQFCRYPGVASGTSGVVVASVPVLPVTLCWCVAGVTTSRRTIIM